VIFPPNDRFDTAKVLTHRAAMKLHMFLRVMPFAGALALLACEAPPTNAAKAGDSKDAAAEGTEVATATPEGDAESCPALSKKICDQAGAQSPTCVNATKTISLLSPKACAAGLADIDFTLQKLVDSGKVCNDLLNRLCNDIGTETQTCKMLLGQAATMAPEQCEQMTGQYDQVLAEVTRMEAQNKPLPADQAGKIAASDAPGYGPEGAAVTVVEFSDFECPYCSMAATSVTELKTKYGDRVRFVFRQFPLDFHKKAHLTAQASLAANAQGKFWEFHDKVFANQKSIERADLEKYAEEIGLDMGKFKKALDEGTYKDAVDADLALGKEVFVGGTPTMFVNGERVQNATDVPSVSAMIDAKLGA
jgi:protein-disulfide isomerase